LAGVDSSERDRRVAERLEAVIVVALDRDGRLGVTRDVSETGILVATRFRFSPGDQLELTIHGPSGPISTTGTVVRVEETPPAEEWRYRIAMHLDTPMPKDAAQAGAQAAAKLLPKK
jgi:hypothetical protein